MLLSTIQLSIRNPGFTFSFEPSADMSDIKVIGLVLLDMLFFLTHPLILKFRSSGLRCQQDAIKASRNLSLSPKYKKNLEKIKGFSCIITSIQENPVVSSYHSTCKPVSYYFSKQGTGL